MAVCVGCGLHVNAGILEVQLCGDGGIKCATAAAPSPSGCTDGLYVDQTLGCGLEKTNGVLEVKAQGQAFNTPVPIGNANGNSCSPAITGNNGTGPTAAYTVGPAFTSGCNSPNCNGLVCTDQGMWAPPSLPSINFSCGQIFDYASNTINNYTQSMGAQGPFLAGATDGFPNFDHDSVFGTAANKCIIVNAFTGDGCSPIDAMSWTAFNINYVLKPGELWRWALWERICIEPTPANVLTQTCGNGPWILQAVQYLDNRNGGSQDIGSVQINDNSTWRFGKSDSARMEAMITFNRLVGAGAADNPTINADFQYRNMGSGYHHQLPQNCTFRDTSL